jgi:carbamate kinase
MYETIIWANDGSEAADFALGEALGLRELSGGRIVAMHCSQRLTGRAAAYKEVAPYPLDILGAETQGMIGYLLTQALGAELPMHDIAALVTQVVVDPDDPAFADPAKPIGPIYEPTEARQLSAAHGWTVARDGQNLRRVVPSPEP